MKLWFFKQFSNKKLIKSMVYDAFLIIKKVKNSFKLTI